MKMNIFRPIISLLVIVSFFSCSPKIPKNEPLLKLLSSKEYKDYKNNFFNISSSDQSYDAEYVNKFMQNNKLWNFNNPCDLLKSDLVMKNDTVRIFWQKRCDFEISRHLIENKFHIKPDSLNKIILNELKTKSPEK